MSSEPTPVTERLVVLALGANLGDRAATLRAATHELAGSPGLRLIAASSVYETGPVGGPDNQPAYLNAVLVFSSVLPAREVLGLGLAVEAAHGRTREVRWGPRTLDVDVIVVGDETSDDPELELPHPRVHERPFVLIPWLEADSEATLPGWGPVAHLVGPESASGVVLRSDLRLIELG